MGRGGAPARKISLVSLVAYGPKVSHSALTVGGYSKAVPNTSVVLSVINMIT